MIPGTTIVALGVGLTTASVETLATAMVLVTRAVRLEVSDAAAAEELAFCVANEVWHRASKDQLVKQGGTSRGKSMPTDDIENLHWQDPSCHDLLHHFSTFIVFCSTAVLTLLPRQPLPCCRGGRG